MVLAGDGYGQNSGEWTGKVKKKKKKRMVEKKNVGKAEQ